MNFYKYERDSNQEAKARKEYLHTMFTEDQLQLYQYWAGFRGWGDHEGDNVVIRSNWNWAQLAKVNKAKGIK